MAIELSGHLTSNGFRRYKIIDAEDRKNAAMKLDVFTARFFLSVLPEAQVTFHSRRMGETQPP